MQLATVGAIGDNGDPKRDDVDVSHPKVASEYESKHTFAEKQSFARIMENKRKYPETGDDREAAVDAKLVHQMIGPAEDGLADTLKFDVATGVPKHLFQKIKIAETELNSRLSQIQRMKDEFNRDIRPSLVHSCLLLPDALDSDLTAVLHGLSHGILKREPIYLSALDVMRKQETMRREDVKYLVSHIVLEKVMVADVWDQSYGDIETSVHDFAPDGLDFYRGESDASFEKNVDKTKDGVAKLSFIIWKNRQVIWAEIIENLWCRNVNDAEVLAALALQLKCLELGVKKLKHITDSACVLNVINGKHTIEMNDPQRGKYILLRHLKDKFETLIASQKPRQLLFMADSLLRMESPRKNFAVAKLLKKWGPHLKGAPIFQVHQNKTSKKIIEDFADRAALYNHKPDAVFYVTVEKENKLDICIQLISSLAPDLVYLIINKFEEKPSEFREQILSFLGNDVFSAKKGTCSIFSVIINRDKTKDPIQKETDKPNKRKLLVIFDATERNLNFAENTCTIILTEPHEGHLVKNDGIKEVSTATFVHLHGVEYIVKEDNKKSKTLKKNNTKSSTSDQGKSLKQEMSSRQNGEREQGNILKQEENKRPGSAQEHDRTGDGRGGQGRGGQGRGS